MKKSNKGIFLLAFLMALIGSGAVFVYLKSMEVETVAPVNMVSVVIAKSDIPARVQITDDMLQTIQIPEKGAIGSPFQSTSEIVGKYSKEMIYLNQQIHPNAVADEIENDLSLKLTGNNRAMTISLSGDTGVNGLIKVGDFVDVILFLPQGSDQGRISRPDIAKLFLQNIEVLAVNQKLYRNTLNATGDGSTESTSYLMTLSIPIMDVEMMALAETIGSIQLALRPKDGDYIYVTEGAIWQELLLNDTNQMKDMAPEYGVIGEVPQDILPGEYDYDQYIYYVVKYGDTLKSISVDFYGTEELYNLIQQVNRIVDENMILTGTGIKIPVLKERGDNNGN
jgi:Flp pilus assembly protein CpaB